MRLLRLPVLCLLDIISNFNPFEVYKFSVLSKRTKYLTTLKKWKTPEETIITTHGGFELILVFPTMDQWFFRFTGDETVREGPTDLSLERHSNNDSKTRTFFFQDPLQGGLQAAENIIQLFKASKTSVYLSDSNSQHLEIIIDWINNQDSLEVYDTTIYPSNEVFLATIAHNYQKKTDILKISRDPSVPIYSLQPIFPANLELKQLWVTFGFRMHLNTMMSLNPAIMDIPETTMTCEDLNLFLTNWKSGKTNSKLQWCSLGMNSGCVIDFKTIFKGLNPVINDPRTTKRVALKGPTTLWIHGGVDVYRFDGKCAKIDLLTYWSEDPNAIIPQDVIDKYEAAVRWNSNRDDYEVFKIHLGKIKWDFRADVV